MAYKLNKFATLCQEDDVVDIDINLEPTEGEEAEAVEAEIEANEDVAEIADAEDQLENAEIAADEVEEKIEEGEAVVAVSEPAVDNGGDVPADVVVTTDSGKELTAEEVAEAAEKLNEAGEVAPEVVMEQEHFIQKIELITGLSRKGERITREAAKRESTVSYKMNVEGLKEMGAKIVEFIKNIINWIKTKVKALIDAISKYMPTKMGALKRKLDKVAKVEGNPTFAVSEDAGVKIAAFNVIKDGIKDLIVDRNDMKVGAELVITGEEKLPVFGKLKGDLKLEQGEIATIKSVAFDVENKQIKTEFNVFKSLDTSNIDVREGKVSLTPVKEISAGDLKALVETVIKIAGETNKYVGPFVNAKNAILNKIADMAIKKIGDAQSDANMQKSFKGGAKVARDAITRATKIAIFTTSTIVNAVNSIKLDVKKD